MDPSSGSRSASRLMAARWSHRARLGQLGDAGLPGSRQALQLASDRARSSLELRSNGRDGVRRPSDALGTIGGSRGFLVCCVMAPSRQMGFRERFLEGFPKGFPTGKFLCQRFPWSWTWALIWEHFWDMVGNFSGRFTEPPSQQIGLGMGVAPAGEAPLAVEVERVVDLAAGRRGRGRREAP